MAYKLLIDNDFKNDFLKRLRNAKKHIELQFMTFEGDKTGISVSKILIKKAKKVKIRVIIDYFTDLMVSDTYVGNKSVKKEIESTKKMIKDMQKAGIEVYRSNPLGLFKIKFLIRNHKKIIVIDNYAYLGGTNISDHNFAWHDFMVGITRKDVNYILNDFNSTWNGLKHKSKKNFLTEKELGNYFKKLILNAKSEIILSTPYFMDFFTQKLLVKMVKKGIKIKILTLKRNNFLILRLISPYVFKRFIKNNIEIYKYNNFSHAKYLIIDRKKILFGSSNLGTESFYSKKELCMFSQNKKLVNSFVNRLYKEDIKNSIKLKNFKAKFYFLSYIMNLCITFLIKYSSIILKKYFNNSYLQIA